eukprot:gene28272-34139_t
MLPTVFIFVNAFLTSSMFLSVLTATSSTLLQACILEGQGRRRGKGPAEEPSDKRGEDDGGDSRSSRGAGFKQGLRRLVFEERELWREGEDGELLRDEDDGEQEEHKAGAATLEMAPLPAAQPEEVSIVFNHMSSSAAPPRPPRAGVKAASGANVPPAAPAQTSPASAAAASASAAESYGGLGRNSQRYARPASSAAAAPRPQGKRKSPWELV